MVGLEWGGDCVISAASVVVYLYGMFVCQECLVCKWCVCLVCVVVCVPGM